MTTEHPGHMPEKVSAALKAIQKEMFAAFEAGDLFNALRLHDEYNQVFMKAYLNAKG